MTNADARSTNNQPRLPVIQPRADPLAVPSPVGDAKPQTTKPSAMAAATANRTLSTAQCRSATQGGGSAMAGWVPVTVTSAASTVEGSPPAPGAPLTGVGSAPTASDWLSWREGEPCSLRRCSMTLPYRVASSETDFA